ncbi:MAG: type II secretion system secretin GspD [bacterium]
MIKRFITIISFVVLVIAGVVPLQAQEPGLAITSVTVHKPVLKKKSTETPKVTMDFNDVDIKDFIKVISKITGKDFILGQNVSGKVTIISPTPVTIDEAWRIFESVLQVNQLTTVGTGNVIKIMQLQSAKGADISTYFGREPEKRSDVYITQVVPLHYITANDMANVLRPFLSSFGNIQPYDPTNTLIITESASNIDRLLKIIKELDTDINRQTIQVIRLKYATAQSIASIISNLYSGQTKPVLGFFRPNQPAQSQPIKVLSDDRTNSIIVVASAEEIASIEALIQKLDVPVAGEGQIHVYYLKNANAEKLASTLATLAGSTTPSMPGQPAQHGPSVAQLSGGVKITADPSTNSLIIIASPQDYQVIKNVVQQLDIRRRQVYVQAVIAELSLSGSKQLGVDLNAIPNLYSGGTQVGAVSNMGAGSQMLPTTTSPLGPFSQSGISMGVINGTITLNGVTYPNIIAFINALETNSEANVLSTPNILATDNEPAEIMVGENVPIPTGQAIGQISGYTQTFVQRQDVGLKLKITPQINAGDYVRLKLDFELTSIIPSPQGLNANEVGITTSKRSAQTVVTVKDRSTIVIGGLLQNNSSVSESKIPFLGDLPLIGWLFRYSNKSKDKTDLMIFLTPYIVKSEADIAKINEMKEEQSRKFEKETFGYELKNSPFKATFDEMNKAMKENTKPPAPLLFTGETYITPEGEFTVGQKSLTETGTTITTGTAITTGTTSTITGTSLSTITGTSFTQQVTGTTITTGIPEVVTPKALEEPTSTTTAVPLTGNTFTNQAIKPAETTNKP